MNHPMDNIKLAKPVFNCLRLRYNFERSSPYTERFINILRRIHESGIERILKQDNKIYNTKWFPKIEEKVPEKAFVVKLISVLICGYAISSIVFLIEWKMNLRKMKLRKINVKEKISFSIK